VWGFELTSSEPQLSESLSALATTLLKRWFFLAWFILYAGLSFRFSRSNCLIAFLSWLFFSSSIGYWTIILIDANYTSTCPYFPLCLSADPLICADILTQMIFVAPLLIFHLSLFHIHFLCRIFPCCHNIVTSHFLRFLFLNLSLFFEFFSFFLSFRSFLSSQPLVTNPLAVFARY
jgi:hypothetical protein